MSAAKAGAVMPNAIKPTVLSKTFFIASPPAPVFRHEANFQANPKLASREPACQNGNTQPKSDRFDKMLIWPGIIQATHEASAAGVDKCAFF
jgi:hypothetical protein